MENIVEREENRTPFPEYPRPQMVRRSRFMNLNGMWKCSFYRKKESGDFRKLDLREYSREALYCGMQYDIRVPYSPETVLSGIGRTLLPSEILHYRRTVEIAAPEKGHRILLHFGAVDQACRVLVNGKEAGFHLGGYLPFSLEITEFIKRGENVLEVFCEDISETGENACGKQRLRSGGMYYSAQSGIWQSVWLEEVPAAYIESIRNLPDYDGRSISIEAKIDGISSDRISCGEDAEGEYAAAEILEDGEVIARAKISGAEMRRRLRQNARRAEDEFPSERVTLRFADIAIPNMRSWSPEDPFLYEVRIKAGEDCVTGYFGMRCFSVEQHDGRVRFCLNHRPYFLNGVLDQGYWQDGLMTPPDDGAFVTDILRMKKLGFNMLRKHCKIEPQRWYYHCDRLGMIVWQDMVPCCAVFSTPRVTWMPNILTGLQGAAGWSAKASGVTGSFARKEFIRESKCTLQALFNCVSVSTWVIFNEGWGQFETEKLTKMFRKADPSRTIDAASGWFDFGCGDFISIHNYFRKLTVPKERKLPGQRKASGRAPVISEYGGISMPVKGHTVRDKHYGYGIIESAEEFRSHWNKLRRQIKDLEADGLSGAVYTQLSDIEEEINGLYTFDRKCSKFADSESLE